MAYNAAGLKLINVGGAISAGAGSVKNIYHYATNDTKVAVETDGYFDDIAGDPLNAGDLVMVSGDVDGTPWHATYIVSVGGGDVSITPAANLTFNSRVALTARVTALGTASNHYVVS